MRTWPRQPLSYHSPCWIRPSSDGVVVRASPRARERGAPAARRAGPHRSQIMRLYRILCSPAVFVNRDSDHRRASPYASRRYFRRVALSKSSISLLKSQLRLCASILMRFILSYKEALPLKEGSFVMPESSLSIRFSRSPACRDLVFSIAICFCILFLQQRIAAKCSALS